MNKLRSFEKFLLADLRGGLQIPTNPSHFAGYFAYYWFSTFGVPTQITKREIENNWLAFVNLYIDFMERNMGELEAIKGIKTTT